MKRSVLVCGLWLLLHSVNAQLMVVPAEITFYGNGQAPLMYAQPQIGQTVYINFNDSTKMVRQLSVIDDSLIIATGPDTTDYRLLPQFAVAAPPYYQGLPQVFDRAGVYRAYERYAEYLAYNQAIQAPTTKQVGTFRILPQLQTTPNVPVTATATQLQLIIGQTHSACPPGFTKTDYRREANKIYLVFTEIPADGFCTYQYIDPAQSYGPEFNLGLLPAGNYSIYIEDSVLVGTVKVAATVTVGGQATIMQNPLIEMVARPIAGAKITAEVYEPCPWMGRGITGVICSTITDNQGAFALQLPESLAFTITATKPGYYPQSVPLAEKAGNLHFEMLDSVQAPGTDMEVTVTNSSVPVESAYVYLNAGHEPVPCPLLAAKPALSFFSGWTDRAGKVFFKNAPLSPFIDYVYTVSKSGQTRTTKSGIIRLYRAIGWENTLTIEMGSTAIVKPDHAGRDGFAFAVGPNPVTSEMVITVPSAAHGAMVQIYNVRGDLTAYFEKVSADQVVWRANDQADGIYVVKMQLGRQIHTQKIVVRK